MPRTPAVLHVAARALFARNRRWMSVGLLAGPALWLVGVTAIWAVLHGAREVAISWRDIALPTRWHDVQRALGDRYHFEGEVAWRQGDFHRALHFHRAGFSRAPGNLPGRLALVRLYLAHQRPDLAKPVLLADLPDFATHADYLDAALGFLDEFEFDSDLADACDRLLASGEVAVRRTAALHAARLAHRRGEFDRSAALIRVHALERIPAGAVLLAQLEAEQGLSEVALLRLDGLLQHESPPDAAYATAAQICRRLGRTRDAELLAVRRLAQAPLAAAPRLELLSLLAEQGREAAVNDHVLRFRELFAADPAGLLGLAEFAAAAARPELARQLQRHFHARGWRAAPLALLVAEASLAAGQPADALVALRSRGEEDADFAMARDGLVALALHDLDRPEEARWQLQSLLTRPTVRPTTLRRIAARFHARGEAGTARELLARASALEPALWQPKPARTLHPAVATR
jgi:hypothetical protein